MSPGLVTGTVIGLLGPTGVGKTAVAVELARLLGTRIISCDSMQVYRDFPVLTNQPSAAEGPHALVGFVEPTATFSAAEYAALARPLIEEDLSKTGHALVAGGTGLYMRAALAPLALAPGGDRDVRSTLEARAVSEGPAALHAELAGLDPEAAAAIDARNVRRVIRALEAVAKTGRAWSGRSDLWSPVYPHPTLIVGITRDREELYARIDRRAAYIMDAGAVAEVERFRGMYGSEATRPGGPGIRSAIGYGEIWEYLEGAGDWEETVAHIAAATRRYARRQLTWLRKVKDAVIIDVQGRSAEAVAQEIIALLPSAQLGRELDRS